MTKNARTTNLAVETKRGETRPAPNQVFLRGRLAQPAAVFELPSGDTMFAFRVTVERPPGDRVRVDSIDCATIRPRAQRALQRGQAGDELEVTGCLHRRFWRTPNGPASRYTVDVETVRLMRADRRGGASRARTPASG